MVNKPTFEIKIAEHGFVKLVDFMGTDERIVECARCLKEDWRGEADEKLIRYMLLNHHTSPFEHVVFTFHVKAPIFIFRQWHRHRTWSYNEISARYKQLSDESYVPLAVTIGTQAKKNHQSRDINVGIVEDEEAYNKARQLEDAIYDANKASYAQYQHLLDNGCPREIARGVLPVNIYSEMYATVDLHNLMHFIRLRLHKHAQFEIQSYARALLEGVKAAVPFTAQVFINTLLPVEEFPLL